MSEALPAPLLADQLQHLTDELEAERATLRAFVSFSRATAETTDVHTLARQAITVLEIVLQGVSVGYYERAKDLWQAQVWSDTIAPEVIEVIRAGLPITAPNFSTVLASGRPLFVARFDAAAEGAPEAQSFEAAAFYPCLVAGEVQGILVMGTRSAPDWSLRDRQVFETLGSGLTLALERAEHVRQLERNAALDAFVALTEAIGSELDPRRVAERAVDVLQMVMPDVSVGYYHLQNGLWQAQVISEDMGSDLVAVLRGGLSQATPGFEKATRSMEAVFTDSWDAGTGGIQHTEAYGAAAFYPLYEGTSCTHMLVGGTQQARAWTPRERALFSAVGGSLKVSLNRASQALLVQVAALETQNAELDRRARQLEQSNADLKASNEELEAFTYSASHDLRTPVRHIMSFAELARKALVDVPNEKAERYLGVVEQAALRMTSLIDGMLLLSRSGRQDLHLQPVDLNLLAAQARRDAMDMVGSHAVRWHIGVLPRVQGDHTLLQQVMTNLLSNAVKYSAKRKVSEIKVWAQLNASEWTISVQDNGAGFPPDYAQKLFGIFQRLHTEKEFEGIGVGLATVKRIVQRHGGQVFAESDGRTGATFSFTLPKPG